MTGTATDYHDDSVTLAEIKQCVADCGYACTGECLPEHVAKPGEPPETMAMTMDHTMHAAHSGHVMPSATDQAAQAAHDMGANAGHPMPEAKDDVHVGHEMAVEKGEMAAMAHEMGHGGGMSMEGMVKDMRNRFLVSFILAIPVFLYSPLFTDTFG